MTQRQRVYRTHALILRRRDYADADRILTVFTPNLGKLELIAKGVRKTTSRKAGHLEIFTHSSLLVAQARTWDIITEAVTVESFRNVRNNLNSISQASYVTELVDCFTEADDENHPMWELVLLVLRALDSFGQEPKFDAQVLLRWFELHLLSLTGFQPQLFNCLHCGVELEAVTNYLNMLEGGILCPRCHNQYTDSESIEVDVLKILRYLQSHPWSNARQLAIRSHIMRKVENVLYRYLLTVLERQLKSADFMRRLQMMAQ